jgi:adenylate cyclase
MSRLLKATFLGLFLGILGVVISFLPVVHDTEENAGLGLLFKVRGARKAPSEVVVVSIDRESAEHLNAPDDPEKWPRSLHAGLVEKLAREGARVITFDVYFKEPRSAEEDTSLAAAVNKARNVVLAESLKLREVRLSDINGSHVGEHSIVTIMKPFALLSSSAFATAPFVLPRTPVRVNQYWTFQTYAGDSPTFPVVAFQLYALPVYGEFVHLLEKVGPDQAGKLPRDPATAIRAKGAVKFIRDIRAIFESDPLIAEKMIEALEHSDSASADADKNKLLKSLVKMYGGDNRRYLNYYGPPRTLTTVPFHQALRFGEDSGSDNRIDLKGKAVFVGLSEILLSEKGDSFHTVFSQAKGVFISGVEIAATAFSNLLDDTAVKPLGSGYNTLIILTWGTLVGIICRMVATVAAALGIVSLSLFYLVTAEHQFEADGTWFPVVVPLFLQAPLGFFGAVLWNYFETNKERRNIRKALGYYVPDEVVHQVAKNIVDMKRGGQTVYGACLFTDAAGYTTVSEAMGPKELSDFMHKYFEATCEPVKQNGGLVVDVKGDSILAIWKAGRSDVELRKQACQAALGVAKAVSHFNQSFDSLKLFTRVGVHAGQIFLGNIGAQDHYTYGVTGDTVNTASRMDSLNKYLGTEILVSEEIIHEIDGFLTREAGRFLLKGKAQPIVVHELLCRMEEADEKQKRVCAIFAAGLLAFRRRSWDQAKEKFFQCIQISGNDSVSNFYLKLCDRYENKPPEESWEGVIPMEEK